MLQKLAAQLSDNQYFVGDKLSLADICIFNMCHYLTFPACKVIAGNEAAKKQAADCLKSAPTLAAHFARIGKVPTIKAWIDSRPSDPHDNVLELEGK